MDMDEGTIALTVMTGLILIVFVGFLVWGISSGQFKNVEDAKYQIFRHNGERGKFSNSSEKKIPGEEGGEAK
jgi:nitrogen fixation-related uncharacterized protein